MVRISVNGIPAGSVRFKVDIIPLTQQGMIVPANEIVQRFCKPFLSYASEDRVSVLKAAQLLSAFKMEYFQDILTLSPGERWERKLYSEIDRCDLFLLFWSQHASKSEWVIKEAEYALLCRKRAGEETQSPEIVPILLEGPPPPTPPLSLSEIHFNDPLRYVIFAEQAVAKVKEQVQALEKRSRRSLGRFVTRQVMLVFLGGCMIAGGALIWDVVRSGNGNVIELGGGFLLLIAAFVRVVDSVRRPSKEAST
jgi:hypothetical protein